MKIISNISIILFFCILTLIGTGCSEGDIGKIRALAEQGDANAQVELGLAYYNGKEVSKDKKLSAYWFLKAAKQNNISAQHYMGWIYSHGDGLEKDIEKAIFWYTKAAGNGHVDSQVNLANIYMRGEVIEKHLDLAYKWYQSAAKKGDPIAQYELGIMYYLGEYVPVDRMKAKELFEKSAAQGNKSAEKAFARLEIEKKSEKYSQKRMDDIYFIANLLEEYKTIANHYPFYDKTTTEDGYVKVGTLVTIASAEAEKQLAKNQNPFGISAARAYSTHLQKELESVLKQKIKLPVDPQSIALYAPNAYYIWLSPDSEDYLIMSFLYSPNNYTSEFFNLHANVYAIASSSAISKYNFWKSAGIKPRIFNNISGGK